MYVRMSCANIICCTVSERILSSSSVYMAKFGSDWLPYVTSSWLLEPAPLSGLQFKEPQRAGRGSSAINSLHATYVHTYII